MRKRYFISILTILLVGGCQEKKKPNITINPNLSLPITCMKLNLLGKEKELTDKIKQLYSFDEKCNLILSLSSKKDIVCNSPQNVMLKTSGKFPRSYLKLKLRKGMELQYSYYIDLYSNVDEDDVEEAFERLKKDIISKK